MDNASNFSIVEFARLEIAFVRDSVGGNIIYFLGFKFFLVLIVLGVWLKDWMAVVRQFGKLFPSSGLDGDFAEEKNFREIPL